MADVEVIPERTGGIDPDTGKRIMLVVGLVLELVMTAAGLWPAAWLVLHYTPSAHTPGHWVLLILAAVLVFNYGYLVALLAIRIVIPRPRPGHYPMTGGPASPVMLIFMLNALLLKARHDPPWAAMFASVFTRIPPLSPLFRRYFGPRTTSTTIGDTTTFFDPTLTEAGKNVQFGFGCIIIAHHFDNRGLVICPVVIGDKAVIGGFATLMAGVEVGHHAVVGYGAVVPPNTKIGPYEYWAGSPAKKVKDITPA